jgi:ATP-binding protein involved in chromosome partitioning
MMDLSDDKLQWSDDDKMLPSENFGIKMMSVGLTTPKRDTPLVWRSSVAVSALIQFLEDVAWGELDYMVIDMPPGTGDIQLTMAQELPIAAAVLVTTPQMVANDDVSRAIMMFKETGVAIGGLVENMSYFIAPDTGNRYDIFGKDGGVNTAIRYDIPFLGSIPLDMEIREMSDEGRPPVSLGRSVHKEIYCELRDKLLKVIEELN